MKRGAKLIYQGVLLQPSEVGIPDLLERVPGRSRFGRYFYRPVDIKSGSGFADHVKGKLRHDYGMQL